MSGAGLALLAVVAGATAAVPQAPTPEAGAPGARLVLEALPEGARVEVDGLPVDDAEDGVALEAGTYLVTVFLPGRPPLEAFVDLPAEGTRTLRVLGAAPPPAPGLVPTLLGSGTVAVTAGALWWLLAEQSADAAAAVPTRLDLSFETRQALLAELDDRERFRRTVAVGAAVAGAALLTAGAVVALAHPDGEARLVVVPAPGGVAAAWTLSF